MQGQTHGTGQTHGRSWRRARLLVTFSNSPARGGHRFQPLAETSSPWGVLAVLFWPFSLSWQEWGCAGPQTVLRSPATLQGSDDRGANLPLSLTSAAYVTLTGVKDTSGCSTLPPGANGGRETESPQRSRPSAVFPPLSHVPALSLAERAHCGAVSGGARGL